MGLDGNNKPENIPDFGAACDGDAGFYLLI
jgi:hypothetical protein